MKSEGNERIFRGETNQKVFFYLSILSKLDGMLEIIMCNENRRISMVYCIRVRRDR